MSRAGLAMLLLALVASCAQDENTDPLSPQFWKEVGNPRALAAGSVHIAGGEIEPAVVEETYEFNAVRSGAGFAARGHIAWNVALSDGTVHYGRAKVGCAAVVDGSAWIAGSVDLMVRNGEQTIPGNGSPLYVVMRVTDGGEGNAATDHASVLNFPDWNPVDMYCTFQPPLPVVLPVNRGNVTVHTH